LGRSGLGTLSLCNSPPPTSSRKPREAERPRSLIALLDSDKYCHPLYATTMVDYGVDIDAPEPPFVLFKVLYRKTPLGTIVYPFLAILKLLTRIIASFIGYLVGFVLGDEGDAAGGGMGMGGAPVPVSRDARIPRPVWGPDLSLMDDEYL